MVVLIILWRYFQIKRKASCETIPNCSHLGQTTAYTDFARMSVNLTPELNDRGAPPPQPLKYTSISVTYRKDCQMMLEMIHCHASYCTGGIVTKPPECSRRSVLVMTRGQNKVNYY